MCKLIAMLTGRCRQDRARLRAAVLLATISMAIPGSSPAAQDNLGQLLDTGAKLLSPEEFRQELMQRTIVGPTATGGTIELIYAPSGLVAGTGIAPAKLARAEPWQGETIIRGEWRLDDNGAVCTVLRVGYKSSISTMAMAQRCQYWFKSGDQYFLADSNVDRQAKVFVRAIKP